MNRFDWNKLSPDEFQRLQDYISCKCIAQQTFCTSRLRFASDAPKKVKDVIAILEKDATWLTHRYDEVRSTSFDVWIETYDLLSFSKWTTRVFDSFSIC